MSLLQEIQKAREDKLVVNLLQKIEPYVNGRKDEFVDWARRERETLKESGKHSYSLFLILEAGCCWHLIALFCCIGCVNLIESG
jgi:hypothetical protein